MQSISKKMSEMEIEQNTAKTTEATETLNDKDNNETQTPEVGKKNKKSMKSVKKTIRKAYKAQWELNMAIEELNEILMQYCDDTEGVFYSMPRSFRKRISSTNSSSSSTSSSETDEEETFTNFNSKEQNHTKSRGVPCDKSSAQKDDPTKSSKSKCCPERDFENHRDFHFNFNYGRFPTTGSGPSMRHREMGFPHTRNFGPLFMNGPRHPFGFHHQQFMGRPGGLGGPCGGFGRF